MSTIVPMSTGMPIVPIDARSESSCTDQIAIQVKNLILRGMWEPNHRIPTERILATHFGVSVPTVNKAMAALAASGYLVRHAGVGTTVAPNASKGSVLLAFQSHVMESSSLFFRVLVSHVSQRILAAGFNPELTLAPRNGPDSVDQSQALRSLGRGHIVGVISLGWSVELAREAESRGIRQISITSGNDVIDGARLDYSQAITLAVAHLATRGHRKVALLARDPGDGHLGIGRPFARAIEAHKLEGRILSGIGDAISAAHAVKALLDDTHGARSIILADENLAPGILLLTSLTGIRMPSDLAVVSHASFGIQPSMTGTLTTCGFDVREVADILVSRCLKIIHERQSEPMVVSVPAHLTQGDST